MKPQIKTALLIALCLTMTERVSSLHSKPSLGDDEQVFIREEMAWRKSRDKEMRAPDSWLNIAGLFWLTEGENRFGTSKENLIVLPEGSAPLFAGSFHLNNGTVKLNASSDAGLKLNGNSIQKSALRGDDAGQPDVVELNDLRMWVIKRFNRVAIRLRDLNHAPYKNYRGLDFFPPTRTFKIEAEFHPFSEHLKVEVGTVIGETTVMKSPGYITFEIDGEVYRLDAFSGRPNTLFIIFGDETNGEETYEASRFIEANILENGKVDLNFNRAFNPPCAYTAYATCPLPPSQNRLKIRIPSGEKKYPDSLH